MSPAHPHPSQKHDSDPARFTAHGTAPCVALPHRLPLPPLTIYPQAPDIVQLYALNVSPSMIRAKKRADFDKHRGITDLGVIDLLLFKSYQEYQETMNCWKQEVRRGHREGGSRRLTTLHVATHHELVQGV